MAISIASKGANLKDDLEHANIGATSYLRGFSPKQQGALQNAIAACVAALDVDGNHLHATNLTIAATLTSNSISITIS